MAQSELTLANPRSKPSPLGPAAAMREYGALAQNRIASTTWRNRALLWARMTSWASLHQVNDLSLAAQLWVVIAAAKRQTRMNYASALGAYAADLGLGWSKNSVSRKLLSSQPLGSAEEENETKALPLTLADCDAIVEFLRVKGDIATMSLLIFSWRHAARIGDAMRLTPAALKTELSAAMDRALETDWSGSKNNKLRKIDESTFSRTEEWSASAGRVTTWEHIRATRDAPTTFPPESKERLSAALKRTRLEYTLPSVRRGALWELANRVHAAGVPSGVLSVKMRHAGADVNAAMVRQTMSYLRDHPLLPRLLTTQPTFAGPLQDL